MKLEFEESPKAWRKAALLALIGPTVIACGLRWRHHLTSEHLAIVLLLLAATAGCICLRPRWFRGYYRFTTWAGFHFLRILTAILLLALYFLFLTPLGWVMRMLGKDPLQLRMPPAAKTHWQAAKSDGSLNDMY